jgi:release factor glutamine methyltransferase
MEKVWTVLELIQWTTGYLRQKGIENSRREAEDLLGSVLDLDRLKLYLAFEDKPSAAELSKFRALVARRAKREPLQYLLGWQPFLDLKISCDARALIPRPETERLAEMALEKLKPLGEGGRFADIGTGSGCIALALLSHSASSGVASDVSPQALDLARENAAALGLQGRLQFALGKFFEPLEGSFDLIVSNPPYIPSGDGPSLQHEVRDYEPQQALFSGSDGLQALKQLIPGALPRLKPGGWLMLECGKGQAEGLLGAFGGGWAESRVEKDPFGIERFLVARSA